MTRGRIFGIISLSDRKMMTEVAMKTLLAVDGNNILNRAYYGIRPMNTSAGLPTNAVYGFISMLQRQVDDYSPDMCAVAFDLPSPTFRHRMYGAYKGTRKPMDDNLRVQLPYIREAAAALGFAIIEAEGYEADDVLGTLASNGPAEGYRTLIMSGDRDCFQLIDGDTSVIYPGRTDYTLLDPGTFLEKYGIRPDQVVDLKSLMGDSSDNIPGVPGIGEKGAGDLLRTYSTLDGVYAALDGGAGGMKPSVAARLAAGRESAYMSRELATIFREVPGLPAPGELAYGGIERDAALDLFRRLEFTQFVRRFGLDRPAGTDRADAAGTDQGLPETRAAADLGEFERLLSSRPAGISVCGGNVYASDGRVCLRIPADADVMRSVADASGRLCCWDCKSLYEYADSFGVSMRSIGFDCMLAAYAANPETASDTERALAAYLKLVRDPSVSDAVYAVLLEPALRLALGDAGAGELYSAVELPLAGVLADMEEAGFLIDREGLAAYGAKLSAGAEVLRQRIYGRAGCEFNINSPKQLGEVLFEKLGLPAGKKKAGGYSTNAEILEKLAPSHPIVGDVLEYRKLCKLNSTYVAGLLRVADPGGRVHTSFRQTGTVTGRLSSAEPNLQNIPVRTEEGRELRRFFLPSPGHVLIDADYSQIELRLLACISGDAGMIDAFNSGADIHRSTAAAVFGVPEDEVTPELRKRAKAVNFGIVYGIGEYSLSQDINTSVREAKKYIESYMARYPGVASYLRDVVERAKRDGYTTTLFGRRRYIPELSDPNANRRKFGERVAMNSPIQGSAADIIKIAMIRTAGRLRERGLDARLILQVHDELIIDSSPADAAEASEILRREMENAVSLPVPLSVELTVGGRWLE